VGNVIQIDGLVKRYGSKLAVDGITLEVSEEETFGYLGPNGAGKTTTIRAMLGLIRPTAGTISVLGHRIDRELSAALTEVGHLPGEFGLWPQLTGHECLEYLGRLSPRPSRRRGELCERFDLKPSDLDRQVRLYSRGMKQKVGIVQAFQHDPVLAVLDEPTEGLDPVMKERFVELLAEHRKAGGATFLSSHILSEVEQAAGRVGVIREGRLVRVGPTDDLTGDRVRHCTLTLKDRSDPAAILQLAGASNIERLDVDGTETWRFDIRGDMEALMTSLGRMPVQDFVAQPERLVEAFFDVFSGASGEPT
jgi:ABC-2 type transport system ATP-binding protein